MSDVEQRIAPVVDERFFAAPPAREKLVPWRTGEIRLLREHYAAGGAAAALATLPGRSRKAIQCKAAELELRAPYMREPRAKPVRYESSAAIDAEIERVYQAHPGSGEINALARRIMRPRSWIVKRAAKLGITTPRYRPEEWSEAELEILRMHAHQSYGWIRERLRQRGFRRTQSAVATKVKCLGLERTDPDTWTTGQLAGLMGVATLTVFRWVNEEGLPATRKSNAARSPFLIERASLRRWIATHAQLVDLRKVERYWFIDLMAGDPATGSRRARASASKLICGKGY